MKKRANLEVGAQAGSEAAVRVEQLLLPLVAGMVRSKQALLQWVHQVGLMALGEVFEHDAE